MRLVEELVAGVATSLFGSPSLIRDGKSIDLSRPGRAAPCARRSWSGAASTSWPTRTRRICCAPARARGLSLPDGTPRGKTIDELLSTYVEPHLIEPIFLLDYPIELSPLTKPKIDDPTLVERAEAFAGGVELANIFTELNDPQDQRRRFEAQAADRIAGDAEAHSFDEEFLEAMEHGMPPAGGVGIGMDRLAMFLTGAENIRDVILFPQLRRAAAQDAASDLEQDSPEGGEPE